MNAGFLDQKVVLITGAAQGLCFAMSQGCAENRATVIMADIQMEKLSEAVVSLQRQGLSCHGVKMDITDWDNITSVMREIVSKYGWLDGLVNNAGIADKVKSLCTAGDSPPILSALSCFCCLIRAHL